MRAPTPKGSMLGVYGPQQGGALGLVALQASLRCWVAGLHHSPPLLTGKPSSPASILQLLLLSLLCILLRGAGGVLAAEVLGTELASPQQCCSGRTKDLGFSGMWMEQCQCPARPCLSGLEKVSLLSPSPPGQCFPLCKSVPRAPACKKRCLMSQVWISTSRWASSGRGRR